MVSTFVNAVEDEWVKRNFVVIIIQTMQAGFACLTEKSEFNLKEAPCMYVTKW